MIHSQQLEMACQRKKIETAMNNKLKQREFEHNKYYKTQNLTYWQIIAEILECEEGIRELVELRENKN